MIGIRKVDHLGIRVTDEAAATAFYRKLGFEPHYWAEEEPVVILTHPSGVEINFIVNANQHDDAGNVLMDIEGKYPGYTHVALEVASIEQTVAALEAAGIDISGGPVDLGDTNTSLFIRDPDRNVIELTQRR